MTLKDIMQRKVLTVEADMLVAELAKFLVANSISGAPVTEKGQLVGVVSLHDIAFNAVAQGEIRPHYYQAGWMDEATCDGFSVESVGETRVRDIMTPAVYSLDEGSSLHELVEMMLKGRIHRVLVTRGKKVAGIVTTTDLVRLVPLLVQQPALKGA